MLTLCKLCAAAAVTVSLAACSAVTIQPTAGDKLTHEADYQQRKNYFFWGLAGEHRVNVTEICTGEPAQMQSLATPLDGFLNIVTIGIYAPRTAKVWCAAEADASGLREPNAEEVL